MKRVLLLIVALIVATTVGSAATMCVSTTMATLVGYGSAGCEVQGVLFSNFQFLSLGTGSNQISDLSLINATLSSDNSTMPFTQNWVFSSTTSGGTFRAGFTLSFDVSVVSGNPYGVVGLVQSTDYLNTGAIANLDTAVDNQTGLPTNVTPNPLSTAGCSGCGLKTSDPYLLTSIHTATTVTVPTVGGRPVSTFEQDFASIAPEPVTFVLIGSGLIGLAFVRRRFRKS